MKKVKWDFFFPTDDKHRKFLQHFPLCQLSTEEKLSFKLLGKSYSPTLRFMFVCLWNCTVYWKMLQWHCVTLWGRCFIATPYHFPMTASHWHVHTQKCYSNALKKKYSPSGLSRRQKSLFSSLEYWWASALRLPTDPFPMAATHTHTQRTNKTYWISGLWLPSIPIWEEVVGQGLPRHSSSDSLLS